MYDNFKIGDLVFAKNRQTIFNFSNNPGDGLEDSVLDETKGLGVVVDFNPLITQGHLKIWWSKAQTFTREDMDNLRKIS